MRENINHKSCQVLDEEELELILLESDVDEGELSQLQTRQKILDVLKNTLKGSADALIMTLAALGLTMMFVVIILNVIYESSFGKLGRKK